MSKVKTIDLVCNGVIVRIHKEKAVIEVKEDMTRFEDPFYEFQTMEFAGLDIMVKSFIPYVVPDKPHLIFLCIIPEF